MKLKEWVLNCWDDGRGFSVTICECRSIDELGHEDAGRWALGTRMMAGGLWARGCCEVAPGQEDAGRWSLGTRMLAGGPWAGGCWQVVPGQEHDGRWSLGRRMLGG